MDPDYLLFMGSTLVRFFRAALWRAAVLLAAFFVSTIVILAIFPLLLKAPKPKVEIESRSILVVDLSFRLSEVPAAFDPSQLVDNLLSGGSTPAVSVYDAVRAVDLAAEDQRITALYLRGNLISDGLASGIGAVEEFRRSLLNFKKSGKPIIGFFSYAGTLDYSLYAICDKLYASPLGGFDFNGLATEQVFFGEAFERYGIAVQPFQAGDYKSAIEPFTRKDMSPESREQTGLLLEAIWQSLLEQVSEGRSMPKEVLREKLEKQPQLTNEYAVRVGLADFLGQEGEAIDELYEHSAWSDKRGSFRQVSLADYLKANPGKAYDEESPGIAVIYLDGALVSGEGLVETIGGDFYAREIRTLANYPNLQAVVLRINSPGGSAEGSETLYHEIERLAEKIPVVVSMSSYAASGGYWIALPADKIFASSGTITGSVGVFGLHLSVKDLAERFGLGFDGAKTGPFVDAGSISRLLTEIEMASVQESVDDIYRLFLSRVTAHRKLTVGDVNEVSGGRVWSGEQAKALGLVDEVGGLKEAIVAALELADLGEPSVYQANILHYPEEYTVEDFFRDIFEPEEREQPLSRSFSLSSRMELARWVKEIESLIKIYQDPRKTYAKLPWRIAL